MEVLQQEHPRSPRLAGTPMFGITFAGAELFVLDTAEEFPFLYQNDEALLDQRRLRPESG